MIRINLLAAERAVAKKKLAIPLGQKLTVGCTLLLIAAGLFIGWRYWSLSRESTTVDKQIADAQQEAARLHSIIAQVQTFEQRKTQLSQRVTLIELLRQGQMGPVHMLDQISRALPAQMWLTEVKQSAGTDFVIIDGTCTTQTGVSDFVANLEASGYFKRSIEIVNTQTVPPVPPGGELIKFSIRATFQQPDEVRPAPAPPKPAPAPPKTAG
jgi:type IV pilus assembly protein PilN